jgi:hypothetical protein
MPADVLLVSVLPRLSRTGASALVALDANSLELIRVRCFPAREYLSRSGSMPMEHCRGIAQWDNALWVSMFNAVRRYEVADPETLKLRPGDVFSHPRAVDLHGICVDDDRLLVASTGADTIIEWGRASSEPTLHPLSGTDSRDLRFPARLAPESGCNDWRDLLPGRLHINDVCAGDRESIVVCALRQIFLIRRNRVRVLHADPTALFHDGRALNDGRLVFTDASRGRLVMVDPDGMSRATSIDVASPSEWFVRGLATSENYVYVLRSELGASRQRALPGRGQAGDSSTPGRFGVSVVDTTSGHIVAEHTIASPQLSAGVNAYSIIRWTKK